MQVYGGLLDLTKLDIQLRMLPNVLKSIRELKPVSTPKTITSVRSLAVTLHESQFGCSLCPDICRLSDIYLTIAMTSATAERSFSAMRRLKTYLCQTMSQERLNACMLLHIHKHRTDELSVDKVARIFVNSANKRVEYFGNAAV